MPFLRMPVDGWSLEASVAQFGWAGPVEAADGETRYFAALSDDDGRPFGLRLVQDADGLRVDSGEQLSRSATFALARMLSIAWPADDDGFPAIGQRDPVVEALQAAFPGVRPIGAGSVFEAAVRAVMDVGLPVRLSGVVWRRVADALGAPVAAPGRRLAAFPPPERLLDPDALAGIRGMNGARPLIQWKRERIAALARAALDGDLEGADLRSWDGRLAVEHLARVSDLDPSLAELIAVRGAHHPDVLLAGAPGVMRYAQRAYRLRPGDVAAAESAAQAWSPYRSWVSALMLCAAEDAG